MSATNHTPYLNLPSFVGSDIPGWLTDWNEAMSAIDTGVQNINTIAGTANNNATSAIQQTGQLQNSVNNLQTQVDNIEEEVSANKTSDLYSYIQWVPIAGINQAFFKGIENSYMHILEGLGIIPNTQSGVPGAESGSYFLALCQFAKNVFNLPAKDLPFESGASHYIGPAVLWYLSSQNPITPTVIHTSSIRAWWNGQVTNIGLKLSIQNLPQDALIWIPGSAARKLQPSSTREIETPENIEDLNLTLTLGSMS